MWFFFSKSPQRLNNLTVNLNNEKKTHHGIPEFTTSPFTRVWQLIETNTNLVLFSPSRNTKRNCKIWFSKHSGEFYIIVVSFRYFKLTVWLLNIIKQKGIKPNQFNPTRWTQLIKNWDNQLVFSSVDPVRYRIALTRQCWPIALLPRLRAPRHRARQGRGHRLRDGHGLRGNV